VSRYSGVVHLEPGETVPPEPLIPLYELMNSLDERSYLRRGVRMTGGDALSTPGELAGWLAGHRLVPPATATTWEDVDAAHRLRTALRSSFTGTATVLHEFPLVVRLAADPALEPVADGPAGALGILAARVVLAQSDGSWRRMRMCAAADCRWVFYDGSRNAGGRWCSMASCGNRDKTRAYRQRARDGYPSRRRK
jgi:hypothetical protein